VLWVYLDDMMCSNTARRERELIIKEHLDFRKCSKNKAKKQAKKRENSCWLFFVKSTASDALSLHWTVEQREDHRSTQHQPQHIKEEKKENSHFNKTNKKVTTEAQKERKKSFCLKTKKKTTTSFLSHALHSFKYDNFSGIKQRIPSLLYKSKWKLRGKPILEKEACCWWNCNDIEPKKRKSKSS